MKNKRKKITLRYHVAQDVVISFIIYFMSMSASYAIYKRLEPLTSNVWGDCFKLSVCIFSAIYFLIKYITIKNKYKRKWTIIIESNGDTWYNGVLCNLKIIRLLDQMIFGTVNLKVYETKSKKKIVYMKRVSKKICKYLI